MELLNGVENIVINGEIAHFQQFIHLSQCFQKSSVAKASVSVCMWERAKLSVLLHSLYKFPHRFNFLRLFSETGGT